MSSHDLCFKAKIRKHVYPCKPQFYFIKVGCKGCHLHGHVSLMPRPLAPESEALPLGHRASPVLVSDAINA